MSFPNIPDVDASIDISLNDAINLMISSVAFEELGLAHILNAEAEKIQYVLGTLEGQTRIEPPPTIEDILAINRSVDHTLKTVIKKEMLLQFKLEDALAVSTTTTSTTTSTTSTTNTTTEPGELGSAWTAGTQFGTSQIAKYTFLDRDDDSKTVEFLLGNDETLVGSVEISRVDTDFLEVSVTTNNPPYSMKETQLYVSNVPPTDSAPGQFPYQYTPGILFTSHTFDPIDVSMYAGQTLYIAVHAKIF